MHYYSYHYKYCLLYFLWSTRTIGWNPAFLTRTRETPNMCAERTGWATRIPLRLLPPYRRKVGLLHVICCQRKKASGCSDIMGIASMLPHRDFLTLALFQKVSGCKTERCAGCLVHKHGDCPLNPEIPGLDSLMIREQWPKLCMQGFGVATCRTHPR